MISKAAMKSFMGHLWYMSESLVGVAFFDPMVDTETKIAMVNALKNQDYKMPLVE